MTRPPHCSERYATHRGGDRGRRHGSDPLRQRCPRARRALGWSQSALAERSGVSRPTIARLETGRGVSSTSLLKLAKALDLQISLEPQEKHR
ncbi:helix-turn-helix transcriptional regulator [Corynebacterium aquatimens]|nr:helix-turn-helix transcriptional regulator [Corynebacterium aquatimens]